MNLYNEYKKLLKEKWLTDFEKNNIRAEMRKITKSNKTKKSRNKKKKHSIPNKWKQRKKEYKAYLNSSEWKSKRKQVLERDNNRCVFCFSSDNLHVHHLTYTNFKKELLTDLITLCKNCHKGEHL